MPSASASQVASATLTGIATATAALLVYFHITTRRSKLKLPQPPTDPIMGNFVQLFRNAHRRHENFADMAEQYGPTWAISVPNIWNCQVLLTVDPAVIEHILKTNFENYIKGKDFHEMLVPMLGDGIFNVDGEKWRVQRKTSSHIFTGKQFRNVVERVVLQDITKLINYLGRVADGKVGSGVPECDMHQIFHTFTLDTFAKIGFGLELNGLDDPASKPDFAAAFDRVFAHITMRFINMYWKTVEPFTGAGAAIARDVKILDSFALKSIEGKRQRIRDAESPVDEAGAKDLLDLFMRVTGDDGKPLTDKQLRDMILNMILAGRDTTAQGLSWCLLNLTRNPEIVEKIRREVLDGRTPSYDEVNSLKYTNAVFLETMRLYPSVPANVHTAVKADVLPGGIAIPAGTEVNWFPYAMGRMTWLWGPDAKKFNPDRWIDENGNLKRESQFKFPAFNAGPRVCLGQNMAMVEAVQVLAAVTREFDFERVGRESGDPGPALSLTFQMQDPPNFRVTRRKA